MSLLGAFNVDIRVALLVDELHVVPPNMTSTFLLIIHVVDAKFAEVLFDDLSAT